MAPALQAGHERGGLQEVLVGPAGAVPRHVLLPVLSVGHVPLRYGAVSSPPLTVNVGFGVTSLPHLSSIV